MGDDGRKVAGPALGVLGVLAAIASVWWFAFRPRRAGQDEAAEEG